MTSAGEILRWDGRGWSTSEVAGGPLDGIWGSDAAHVFAVGALDGVLAWNGSGWTSQPLPTNVTLSSVWGTDASNVFAVGTRWTSGVGNSGFIVRWDGSAWTPWGEAASTNGAKAPIPVWGANAHDVWGLGGAGSMDHFDGSCWSAVAVPTTQRLEDVWGTGADDVWAVGDGVAIHWNGRSGRLVDTGTTALLGRVTGSASDDVWALAPGSVQGGGALLHWNGRTWTAVPVATMPNDIVAVGRNRLWAASWAGDALYWDGSRWTTFQTGAVDTAQGFSLAQDRVPLWEMTASGPDDVWAFGSCGCNCGPSGFECDGSVVVHWDGTTWSTVPAGAGILADLWSSGPDDVWGVGWWGSIVHWDGQAWSSMDSGTTDDLDGIGGAGPDGIWIRTETGPLIRYEP